MIPPRRDGYIMVNCIFVIQPTTTHMLPGPDLHQESYTYDNTGNLLKDSLGDQSGNLTSISTYPNNLFLHLIGTICLPVQEKDLLATLVYSDRSGNLQSNVVDSYVFFSSGRLTKETDADDNGQTVIKSLVYY